MAGLPHSHIRRATLFAVAATTIAAQGCRSSTARPAESIAPIQSPRRVLMNDAAGIAKARADSVRRPYTQADIDFMTGMIAHHAQAIAMARWAPTHGASASVLALAGRIINAQQDEIAIMQQWLADRRQPVPAANPNGTTMIMNGVEHVHRMPGMLTPEQMTELDAARGPEFDELFLTFMIQHHRGAVEMVKDLLATNGAAQDQTVFKFSNDVSVDQSTEIDRMQKMLFGTPSTQRN